MSLVVDHLTKRYGEKTVLQDFCHSFPGHGVVALMGPSGCGKTTLLRLIAGLEKSDSGTVRLSATTKLSMVFQEDRLLPTLNARGNVLAVMGEDTADNRQWADQCLARCGLLGEEGQYPAQLSGGMRRRVAIARAIAFGGNVLLLDEPFKGLDAALKREVMEFVLQDRRERLTLLVTHDHDEAAWADHILRMEGPPLKTIAD